MLDCSHRSATDDDLCERRRAARWDDHVLSAMMIAFGGTRVAIAIGDGERFGAEASIAAVMLVLGVVILVWRK